METKKNVRNICKSIRKNLSEDEVFVVNSCIHRKLIKLDVLNKTDVVLGYSSIQNEPDIFPFLEECLKRGKHVYLPKVEGEDISFYEIMNLSMLETGSYQILEPVSNVAFQSQEFAVIFVPGIAFDIDGNRIGFGKGYYDRFLSRYHNLYRIGIAHEFQMAYDWASDSCDEKMNLIITDKNEVLCDGIEKNM